MKVIKFLINHYLLLSLFLALVFGLTLRGIVGSPKAQDLLQNKWMEDGPFELSPERGRYALTYSIIEDKSFYFSLPIARFATPDLGYANGKFVSLFAPGVSFLVAPGYIIGKFFGASQIGSYAIISLFAILNALLIRSLAIHLKASSLAATIGAICFVFATPAFAYGVNLYQHHISTFLILAALLMLFKYKTWWSLAAIWFFAALSIPVDYPNVILMMPILLVAFGRFVSMERIKKGIVVSLHYLKFMTLIAIIIPLGFFLWFNSASYNNPLQISGTVLSIPAIDKAGNPTDPTGLIQKAITQMHKEDASHEKTAVGFFKTRNILNGMYIHIFSPDRGIIYFSPILLFGIIGGFLIWKKRQFELTIIVGICASCIILYSMWGDPWGGWAFGSRYLIPTYALLSVLIGIFISYFTRKLLFIIPFGIIAFYSIYVNTLGAITSSTNPPQVQVLSLEKETGKVQRYSIDRNIEYINNKGTKSFVYNSFLKNIITPQAYYFGISSGITLMLLVLIAMQYKKHEKTN